MSIAAQQAAPTSPGKQNAELSNNEYQDRVLCCVTALGCVPSFANAQSADEHLQAIYTEEWKWRLEQFPGLRRSSRNQ